MTCPADGNHVFMDNGKCLAIGAGLMTDGTNIKLTPASASILGGILSSTAPTNQFAIGVDMSGHVLYAQPAASNVSGLAAVATSGSASDLSTGTLSVLRLPSVPLSSLQTIGVDTSPPALPSVNTLASLKALSAGAYPTVRRLGYTAAGDGGDAVYTWSGSSCSISSGAGDNGLQVKPTTGTGCWIASFPASGADVRAWGAVADGVTDAGPAINTALANYHGTLILPATDSGFYINTTVLVTHTLVGTSMRPINNMGSGNTYPQQSWLLCSRTVNPCVQANNSGALSTGAQLENIIIAGASGAPNSGVVGLQFAGGYQTNTRNVHVVNFDWCVEWGPEGSVGGLGSTNYNLNVGACQTHYFVIDGWPEIRNIGGRAGLNGSGDYGASSDFVYITHTTTTGSGGGPNTIMFDDYHFNPGGSGGVACAINFGGWTGSGGGQNEYRFTNDHFEWHTYTGVATQGIFCSDSTVPQISQLFVSNMAGSTGGLTVPGFSLNSLTSLNQVFFENNVLPCSSITLSPTPASGVSFNSVHFSNNNGCSSASFTANGLGNTFYSNGNQWGGLTLAGNYSSLNVHDNATSFSNTSTGTQNVIVGPNITVSGTVKGLIGGAFGANGSLSAFGKSWTSVAEVDQNATTYAGVVNNTVGASANAVFEAITGTANSFAYWQLADGNGTPVYSLNLGSALSSWTAPSLKETGYLSVTGTSAPTLANGTAGVYASATNGALITGQGSTNDLELVNKSAAAALAVPTGTTNINILGNLTVSGSAPTSCTPVNAGTGATCAFSTGSVNSNGKIIITAGSSAPANGSFSIAASSAVGTNTPVCDFTLSDTGTATWAATAGVHDTTATTTALTGSWFNGGTTLTNASTYVINYHCHGK
jgi:hypothetical protein